MTESAHVHARGKGEPHGEPTAGAFATRHASLLDHLAVLLLSLIVVMLCFLYGGPTYMNADTPFLSVMSLQKVTFFIWGQNRFINIVPLIASPFSTPIANLSVQLILFGGGFVALLRLLGYVVADIIFRKSDRLNSWLCFSALLFVFLLVASPYAAHVFVSEGQPYGLSGLLFGIGLVLMLRHQRPGWTRPFGASIAFLIGGGLNPSLAPIALVVCAVAFVFWPSLRRRAVVTATLSVGSCALWLAIGAWLPGPKSYGSFVPADAVGNLNSAAQTLMRGFDPIALAGTVALALVAGLIITFRPAGPMRPRWALIMVCAAVAVVWFVLFAQNAWIILNGWHFRYFYPVTFAVILVLAAPFLGLLLQCPVAIRAAATAVLVAGGPILIASPWQRLDDLPVFARVAPFVAEAHRQDVTFVAGSYWTVWPTVFQLLRDRPAFGIEEERAAANRANISRAIRQLESAGQVPRSLCIDASVERCLGQAALVTRRAWRPAVGTCGTGCLLIELGEPPR